MLNRLKKGIAAFVKAFSQDMSFDEHAVSVRTELMEAVHTNDATIKEIENLAVNPHSVQMRAIDTFLGKCLEKKLGPVMFELYKEDRTKKIPGLNMDIMHYGNVGTGEFRQSVRVTMYKQELGKADVFTIMDRDTKKMTVRILEELPA